MSCSIGYDQESNKTVEIESIKEEVWKVVEKRNSTWTENNFNGHMAIYHSEFRRWSLHSKKLMTKEIFASFWDGIKKDEATNKIEVERNEMQIFQDGNLAIAHYTINEDFTWIGNNKEVDEIKTITKGQNLKGNLRFSDIYIKEGNSWFYVGGHRDGAYLKAN
jgi:hypothetical protein